MNDVEKQEIDSFEELEEVTIRFAGDSGDGMQLTGNQFTNNTAIFGNDLSTFPDYPSEIRAPAGTLAGVSSFQIQFSSKNIHTPGDELDVLVAMNPAALKVHLKDLKDNGILLVNTASFTPKNLRLANWENNPLDDKKFANYRVIQINMNKLLEESVKDLNLHHKIIARSTNMFALGFLYYLYDRPQDSTIKFLNEKFSHRPELIESNLRALKTGFNYGHTIEITKTNFHIKKAKFKPGTYRNIMGNQAVSFGLLAASKKAGLDLFYGGYPITPASDILHYLAGYKHFGVKTFQAEDEIAGIISIIGASYAGALAVTATSGPGMALKTEALGLAVSTELPMVIVNVQRSGPSTGLPTKTEQSDLLQAVVGRNGDAPLAVLAAHSSAHCFDSAYEASRIALEHMIPVILLTDAYLGNGSEPWFIPNYEDLKPIKTHLTVNPENYMPFEHDQKTMGRSWAIPGTPGMEHRIGGLEKANGSGNVNYTPQNHQLMSEIRQKKIDVIADNIPLAKEFGNKKGELLVIGWGSTFGAIRSAIEKALENGYSVSHLHLDYINPFPKNVSKILKNFNQFLIPELNMGQLSVLIKSKYLIKTESFNKVQGKPFTTKEIYQKIIKLLKGSTHE